MRGLASFKRPDQSAGCGFVQDGLVLDCSANHKSLLDVIRAGSLADLGPTAGMSSFALSEVVLQAPVVGSEKIICVGVNYANRNEEYKDGGEALRYPSLFVRFPDSFVGHEQPILRPRESEQLDYEGEIVLVIGRGGRRIARDRIRDHVAGLTLANDGTVRDWVRHAKFNVTQGKNFDASGSMGPWIVPASEIDLERPLRITTRVNGELRQDDTTDSMIFDFGQLIEYISTFTTLKPGDLILTGTPTGAGARFDPPRWLKPGDIVEVSVPEIGTLRNTVADA
jgi:2-keto-4-pentenoate hydratase/2-oxohepta-3-ene-1,7-dioic acid hydratase in catechol pathway